MLKFAKLIAAAVVAVAAAAPRPPATELIRASRALVATRSSTSLSRGTSACFTTPEARLTTSSTIAYA